MTDKTISCFSCGHLISIESLFCFECGALQKPSTADHFLRLGMSYDFDLGAKKLDIAYFSMQNKLHPDRFARKGEKEKLHAMQHSMLVNEAYETLKNPLSRAEYMLKLQGVIVNSDKDTVKPSQKLLMESLESREKLENLSSDEEIRSIVIATIEGRINLIEEIKEYLSIGKLQEAAESTIRLKYLEKFLDEIKMKQM